MKKRIIYIIICVVILIGGSIELFKWTDIGDNLGSNKDREVITLYEKDIDTNRLYTVIDTKYNDPMDIINNSYIDLFSNDITVGDAINKHFTSVKSNIIDNGNLKFVELDCHKPLFKNIRIIFQIDMTRHHMRTNIIYDNDESHYETKGRLSEEEVIAIYTEIYNKTLKVIK